MDAPIPYVRAAGDPYTLGHRHGAARAVPLRAFLDDGLCRLNRILHRPVSLESLTGSIAAYRAEISSATPALAEEIRGLAAGAGISVDEAYLLQLRREILGYRRVPTMGDCTTYARSGAAAGCHPVLAQTVDLNGDLDDQLCVLETTRAGAGRRSLLLSFGGLLGYLGLNSSGLAVGLNLVLGGSWRPGVPPYLAIRHVLDTASTVEEAVAELRTLRLASSRSFTLCDPVRAVCAEVVGDELRLVEGAGPAHTNHLLHPDLARHDALNVFARRSSVRRLHTCRERLAALPAGAPAEEHFALLSAAPVRVRDHGDIREERTVAAVVMFPDRGELHVRPGDPALSGTQVFSLS